MSRRPARGTGRWPLRAGLALAVLVAGCTAGPAPDLAPAASPEEPTAGERGEAVLLGVVASETGPTAGTDRTYLDGMRLAVEEVNRAGGVAGRELLLDVRDAGGGARATAAALGGLLDDASAAAYLVVGPGSAVASQRASVQELGAPVLLLGGDLYTPRALFRQVFQTSVPVRWQARVLARYLARDRGHRRVLVAHQPGEDGVWARDAFMAALGEEGVAPAEVFILRREEPPARLLESAERADAVLVVATAEAAGRVAGALAGLDRAPQLALWSGALRSDVPGRLPPGTVAPYPYAWAPWARPIKRVEEFRERFEEAFGRSPVGFEQEGYDAVRLLAGALEATGGRAGEPLVAQLESLRPRGPTYSALPLVLGPDDRTLTDETFVGLFAVAGPGEDVEPWVEGTPWRPIIRTFTSDGRRTIFLERDRRAFFPFWRRGRPSPKFFRSRWGISTRSVDPLH